MQILIVEDQKITRESLVECIEMQSDMTLCCAIDSAEKGLIYLRKNEGVKPDILLLDIGLPGMSGIESITLFRSTRPKMDIVMFTTYEEDEKIFGALRAGATSYISKRTSLFQIMDSLRIVHNGGAYMSPVIARIVAQHFHPQKKVSTQLSDRQMDIVNGLVKGHTYQMIADELNVSLSTVRTHIKRVYKALNVNSGLEVVNKFNAGEI